MIVPSSGYVSVGSPTFALDEPMGKVAWMHPDNKSDSGAFVCVDEFDRMDELERLKKRYRTDLLNEQADEHRQHSTSG